MELTGQRGADVAFEVIGLKQTIDETINMTRRGGQAILVGVPAMDVMLEIPANLGMVIASKTVKGCWYGSSNVQQTVPQLLQLHRDGKLMLDELISRTITINDVNEAFEAMEKGEVARSVIEY
jgi:Zn-dependent alcohol dehydrogenase